MPASLNHPQINARDRAEWQRAKELLLGGNYSASLFCYQRLLEKYPAVAELWFEYGNTASGELKFELANGAYKRTLELAPENATLLLMVGQQYQGLRQLDDARICFQRAVAAEPESIDARITLAVWFEKQRRLPEARECVEVCLAKNPRDDQARYFSAFLLHREGRNADAERALRELIGSNPGYPYVKYSSRHLLGVVLDELGQYDEAMQNLIAAKEIVRGLTDTALLERKYDQADQRRRELLAMLSGEQIKHWRGAGDHDTGGFRFAFLGGHPRSGTTLLEQILDAHPELQAFDEPPSLSQEVVQKLAPAESNARRVAKAMESVSAPRRLEMRARYEASLRREGSGMADARVLLDKNPSCTSLLHFWLRVFPELKVIIALRDPRDVVVSCFFLNIMLNATNMNFLSIERTAKHYADLMDVWLRMRELGGFDWKEIRYEDLVNDLEREGRNATEFLGLAWHERQASFYENSRGKFLYAPTYHDVTKPVYRKAIGRWRRYAKWLEPVQAGLAPYCEAFGYE